MMSSMEENRMEENRMEENAKKENQLLSSIYECVMKDDCIHLKCSVLCISTSIFISLITIFILYATKKRSPGMVAAIIVLSVLLLLCSVCAQGFRRS